MYWSGPGPGTPASRITRTAAPVAAEGCSGARSSIARAAATSSTASTRRKFSTAERSLRAACQPMETWSSCIAEDGIESTDAGTARRFMSETSPACVYWAIIMPESTPGSSTRNAGSPCERAGSSMRSVRRSDMLATSATGMARKSSTYATGAPWKLPFELTRPSSSTTGLSTVAASSRSATVRTYARVSRRPPATCGAQRSE